MRIVLVRPPIECSTLAYPAGPRFGVPLGILYLAAACEQAGHEVRVYDALVDFAWGDLSRSANGMYHVGASWERIAQQVAASAPDAVGISNPFSDFAHLALRCAAAVKQAVPDVPVIVGGPHATVCPEHFLAPGSAVDYAVQGEGERALVELLAALAGAQDPSAVPGVCVRQDGRVRVNEHGPFIADLDSLPLPAYHLVDMERYFALAADGFPSRYGFEYPGSERECSLVTSRGCPFRCVFCGNHLHMGRRWRAHSAAFVLGHIRLLVERYGVRHLHIEDDNITLDTARFEAILDGVTAAGWGITWDTPNGVRAEGLSDALIRKIRSSGCTYLVVGVESGDQTVLDTIVRKGLRLSDVERTLAACRRARLDTHAFYIVGFAGETRPQIRRTFAFARRMLWRYDTMPHLGLARPLPGTELHAECERQGLLTGPVRPEIGTALRGEVFERVMIATPEFTPAILERWVRHFNRQVMLAALVKTALWLLAHPAAWPAVARNAWQQRRKRFPAVLARLFYGGLFYKFNYERRPGRVAGAHDRTRANVVSLPAPGHPERSIRMPPAPLKAVLFDLDGTLLNTLDDLADSCNIVLAEMGLPVHPTDAYRYFVGDGVEVLARRVLPEGRRSDADVKAFVPRMRAVYAERETLKTRPYPGVPELLDELACRGIPMAVLSNKPDEATRSVVGKLLGRWRFALVRGALPGVAKKPDPAAALGIAAELGIAPASFLYLGDTGTDMCTATAAGMYPVGALWGFREKRELVDAGAAVVIEHPSGLVTVLDDMAGRLTGG